MRVRTATASARGRPLTMRRRPQAQPYRVSWEIATSRLLSGRDDELYCRATLAARAHARRCPSPALRRTL